MGKFLARNQTYIAIGVVAVLALAVVFLAILPVFQKASEVDSQIQTEQDNLAAAQALLARRQSAKAQSFVSEGELMRIANQIPDSPQLPSVFIELEDVAHESGVELPSVAPGNVAPGPTPEGGGTAGYDVLSVSLQVRGDWVDQIEFLRRVQALDRGVRVTNSSFTYIAATETEGDTVQSSVQLEVYVMAAAGSAPAQ